jgi:hypothetical protein
MFQLRSMSWLSSSSCLFECRREYYTAVIVPSVGTVKVISKFSMPLTFADLAEFENMAEKYKHTVPFLAA